MYAYAIKAMKIRGDFVTSLDVTKSIFVSTQTLKELHMRYIVKDENTLGYIMPLMPNVLGVLAHKDSNQKTTGNTVWISKTSQIRDALAEDFERFNVFTPVELKNT